MSQYSQMIGSFERTGNYPMESNYIFNTEQDLIDFYSDEINNATIHPGLLKVVLNDGAGNQALYWACLNDQDEFEFKKLCSIELENDVEDIKLVVSAALNDLNERLSDIEMELEDSWYEGE